jgi:hypothetical protein
MVRNYVLQGSIVNDFFWGLILFVFQGCEKEYLLSFDSGKEEAPFMLTGKYQGKSKMWLIMLKIVPISLKILLLKLNYL